MESFIKRKRKLGAQGKPEDGDVDEEPTEVKLAILSSLHPTFDQETLLDILLAHDGSVSQASTVLKAPMPPKRSKGVIGAQSSLRQFTQTVDSGASSTLHPARKKLMSKKGATMHLYDPIDISEHTPCSVIHNFLPTEEADELLKELLEESRTFEKITFKLFENVVSSPHTSSFYLESYEEIEDQKQCYLYNGAQLEVCYRTNY